MNRRGVLLVGVLLAACSDAGQSADTLGPTGGGDPDSGAATAQDGATSSPPGTPPPGGGGTNDASTSPPDAGGPPDGAPRPDGGVSPDAGPTGGPQSGLPWWSGASTGDLAAFETWRGKKLDVFETWPNRGSWNEIRNPDIYGAVSAFKGRAGVLAIGIAMLPEDKSGSFATCAGGAYDAYYNDVGTKLKELGFGDAYVRLGWEANGDWYAWSIGSDTTNYKGCFRKEAAAIRATAPGVRIDWNMNKDSHMPGSVADAYPGDDVVDVVGVDFYDAWPAYPTQAAWDGDYNATQNGGPRGLGAWLAFAIAHGKRLSLPEWGIDNEGGGGGGGADDPSYVQNMFTFFQTNAAHMAYESYFNLQSAAFILYPPGTSPNASAAYKARF